MHYEDELSTGIIIYISCVSLVLAFAVCGNILVIYCILRLRNLRTITNIFICNLAISDVLFATYVMPMKLHDISHYNLDWYEGVVHCKMTNATPILVISCSIYILVAISFERRQIMHGKLQGHGSFTWKKLIIVIFLIWVFSIGIASPTLLEYAVQDIKISNVNGNETRMLTSCRSVISRELALANAIFVSIISYIIPVILMTKNYYQIAKFVWKKGKWMKKHLGSTAGSRLFKHRTRIVKLLFIVAAIFAVTWFPFFVILIYAKSTGNDASQNAAGFSNLLLLSLAAFSTAYNVVLYVIFNPSFKQGIIGTLRCNSVSDVNERVMDEPSQGSANLREAETATTCAITDGIRHQESTTMTTITQVVRNDLRHFNNKITPVEVND